jgi:superfamily II DNA or RNA helicase
VIDSTKIFIPAARHTAAFKMKVWDGKESQFEDDGSTKFFMLDKVLPILESQGYNIEIVDNRKEIEFVPDKIDELFLHDFGIGLRYYQINSVNKVIDHEKGILELPTSAGKTIITGAIAKAYDQSYRTIIIVPSENLVNQTYADVSAYDLDVGKITGKVTGKKRDAMWDKRHLVITWQTLNRNRTHLKNYDVVLFDECHEIGDVMYEILAKDLAHAHIRVGLTGTVPDDKHKAGLIKSHLGGDVLYSIDPKELMDQDYISTVEIELVPTQHLIDLPNKNKLEWDTESKYLNKNIDRIKAISDRIKKLQETLNGNILILSFPEIGKAIAKELGTDFIDKDVDTDVRESYYKKYDKEINYTLNATFRTVGTGISINNIQYVFLIDVGKNKTRVLQSIGRGLRKDGIDNHLKVFDIYSEMMEEFVSKSGEAKPRVYGFSAKSHLQQRLVIYNKNEYHYYFTENPILV